MNAHDHSPMEPVSSGSALHGEPPKGTRFMNAARWVLFVALLMLAVGSIATYLAGRRHDGRTAARGTAVRYFCPMHPSYTSDRPGECPICGMTLEPMTAEEGAGAGHGAEGGAVPGLSTVQISPERIQLIGVRTAVATRRAMGSRLELVGFVAPDEGSLRRIQIRASGWIQRLFVNQTGEVVKAGAPLLSIYSPELFQSEQEYLIALRKSEAGMTAPEPGAPAGTPSHEGVTLEAVLERLRLLGVPPDEVARLEGERTASTALTLRSPVTGTVLERNVVEGQSVGADTPLFTIADLSRVWVMADLYEMDFGRVRVGDRAEFQVDAIPSRTFEGRVEFVYPTVSSETRTLKIRFTLANPGGLLRPGMYGRAVIYAGSRPMLAVPAEAVVNAGDHDYAFIARAGGRFEPRLVTTAKGDGTWTPILSGLAEGDTVVSSASFLIDSESRLRTAISGLQAGAGAGAGAHVHGTKP